MRPLPITNQRSMELYRPKRIIRKPVPIVPRRIVPNRTVPGRVPGTAPVDPLMTRANNAVFGMTDPLMQRLAQSRAMAEAGARRAYGAHAGALEQGLMATAKPVGQAFDTAIGQSAAVNEAVANRLSSQGQTASGSLAAQLARIGGNPAGAAELAQTYTGAGNAGFAGDSADLQHLLGRRGESQSYMGKLPQIARTEAARGLEGALSEFRGEFGERETALLESAQENKMNLWNQFRTEGREDNQAKAAAKAAVEDRRSQERMAFAALRATATSKAEQLAYDIKEKNWERQNDLEDAAMEREFDRERDEFDVNNRKPEKQAPAGQPHSALSKTYGYIVDAYGNPVLRNGKRVPVSKTKPEGGPKNDNDSWRTPGSAKQNRVINSVRGKIVNSETGTVRDRFVNSKTPDRDISRVIWSEIRLAVGNTTSPAAKSLYRNIFLSLEGLPSAKGPYQRPGFIKDKKKKGK